MNHLLSILKRKFTVLKDCESGQDLVEYALLVTLIALAVIGGVAQVAKALNPMYSNISTSVANAGTQPSGSGGGGSD